MAMEEKTIIVKDYDDFTAQVCALSRESDITNGGVFLDKIEIFCPEGAIYSKRIFKGNYPTVISSIRLRLRQLQYTDDSGAFDVARFVQDIERQKDELKEKTLTHRQFWIGLIVSVIISVGLASLEIFIQSPSKSDVDKLKTEVQQLRLDRELEQLQQYMITHPASTWIRIPTSQPTTTPDKK
jgi:hypothetical protein